MIAEKDPLTCVSGFFRLKVDNLRFSNYNNH